MKRVFSEPRRTCVFDTECYVNYWSIAFMCIETGEIRLFRKFNDSPLDAKGIANVFYKWRVLGYNSYRYDMPMVAKAMANNSATTNGELKRASDGIIQADIQPWDFYKIHEVSLPDYIDHIDLMPVSPATGSKDKTSGRKEYVSLKTHAGRLHSKTMRDLPFEPDRRLSEADVKALESYLVNDLNVTADLYRELKEQVAIRCQISDQYGLDVRSKSDAQIAEAVIKAEVERERNTRVYKPEPKAAMFHYTPPSWISFKGEVMNNVLQMLKDTPFYAPAGGKIDMPEFLSGLDIKIGDGVYRMGIGGLHSTESQAINYSDDDYVLLDRDVTSFYPFLIWLLGMYPSQLGKVFISIYKGFIDRRVEAKHSGNKTLAETLKIVLNGSFGKFGSAYSVLFSPNLLIQTTVTGQLALLMLIEEFELAGMKVISANTDGVVTKVPRAMRKTFESIIREWEWETGLNTEETEYLALHSRDVNNYIAIPAKGDVKLKGAFAKGGPGLKGAMGMKKNPTNEVCIDAVINFLKDAKPLIDTIRECKDIRQFVSIRKVKGGAVKDGEEVGKVIRFYYANGVKGTITYKGSGNDVPKTEGAKPLMTLPDEFPSDVDYAWYLREATAMLQDLGHRPIDPKFIGRTGFTLARVGDQKTYHRVRLPSGVAACGKAPESLRERWHEVGKVPEGERLCSKCRKEFEEW